MFSCYLLQTHSRCCYFYLISSFPPAFAPVYELHHRSVSKGRWKDGRGPWEEGQGPQEEGWGPWKEGWGPQEGRGSPAASTLLSSSA